MNNETKNLISRIDSIQSKIDKLANETIIARNDTIAAIRDFLEGVDGRSIQLDNLDYIYHVTYEGNNGDMYKLMVKRVFLKDIYDSTSVWVEIEDNEELAEWQLFTEDLFEIFEMIFRAERDKKIAYINGKVAENKPYVIRLNKEFEITYAVEVNPELTKIVTKKIDHIAFTDNEEDGAKAFTDFTNGVNISSLSLLELTEIENEIAKGAYMVR